MLARKTPYFDDFVLLPVIYEVYEQVSDIPELKLIEIHLNHFKIRVDNDAIQKALDELSKSASSYEPRKKMKKQNKGTK